MIIVKVKENENIDRALKRFKKKYDKSGLVKKLRDKQQYTKPSVRKRNQIIKAKYIQKLKNEGL